MDYFTILSRSDFFTCKVFIYSATLLGNVLMKLEVLFVVFGWFRKNQHLTLNILFVILFFYEENLCFYCFFDDGTIFD